MSSAGFEPTISAGKRTQTYALERAATRAGIRFICLRLNITEAHVFMTCFFKQRFS